MPKNVDKIEELPVLERLKVLKEKERAKKKELDELEARLKKESANIKSQISKTIDDIKKEEEEKFLEEEKKKRKESESLEDQLEDVEIQKPKTIENFSYAPNAPKNIYDVQDHNFYEKVKELVNKSNKGYISTQEKQFLNQVYEKITQIRINEPYISKKDPNDYVARTQEILNKFHP